MQAARFFFVGGATRGEWRPLGAQSFAPRAGLPQIEPVHGAALCRPRAFLWEPRPAANGASSVPEQLRPEGGAPTNAVCA